MTTALWLIAAAAVIGSSILVAAVSRWREQPASPPAPQPPEPARPAPIVAPATSALRMVMVTVIDGGIVLDAIVENGNVLGRPGAPVTMLLERADPCLLGAVVNELESWADADAVVDVALVALHGAPAASLRHGEEALHLPILGVRS